MCVACLHKHASKCTPVHTSVHQFTPSCIVTSSTTRHHTRKLVTYVTITTHSYQPVHKSTLTLRRCLRYVKVSARLHCQLLIATSSLPALTYKPLKATSLSNSNAQNRQAKGYQAQPSDSLYTARHRETCSTTVQRTRHYIQVREL